MEPQDADTIAIANLVVLAAIESLRSDAPPESVDDLVARILELSGSPDEAVRHTVVTMAAIFDQHYADLPGRLNAALPEDFAIRLAPSTAADVLQELLLSDWTPDDSSQD